MVCLKFRTTDGKETDLTRTTLNDEDRIRGGLPFICFVVYLLILLMLLLVISEPIQGYHIHAENLMFWLILLLLFAAACCCYLYPKDYLP